MTFDPKGNLTLLDGDSYYHMTNREHIFIVKFYYLDPEKHIILLKELQDFNNLLRA